MPNLLNIIKRKDIAARHGYWLEAIALAHMFMETQLHLIVGGHCSVDEIEKASHGHVWGLAKLAEKNDLISPETWENVKEFNNARNRAVHGLAVGEITYAELREYALKADDLIGELQAYYITVTIGPEVAVDRYPDA